MSVQTDLLPPVPEQAAPLTEDQVSPPQGKLFSHQWTRWFTSLREKVNAINESLVSLSTDLPGTGDGFLAKAGGGWVTRAIQGTIGRIAVSNSDGTSGDPTIDLEPSGVTPGSYSNVDIEVDVYGRVVSITTNPPGPAIPPGGTTGQVLMKLSNTDYDYAWQTLPP